MSKKEEGDQKPQQLGPYLRELRELRGFKLREVEEASGVSNAYLSQIETGKITRPSPRILHKLASVYDVGYEVVMEKAGYLAKRVESDGESKPVVPGTQIPAVVLQDLTPAEEKAVLEYIEFLRHKRKKN